MTLMTVGALRRQLDELPDYYPVVVEVEIEDVRGWLQDGANHEPDESSGYADIEAVGFGPTTSSGLRAVITLGAIL